MTVRTEVRIQEVARTDSRSGSNNSVALSSTQNFAPHRIEVNRGPQSDQTETNGYLNPPRHGTPVVVFTKHNCLQGHNQIFFKSTTNISMGFLLI